MMDSIYEAMQAIRFAAIPEPSYILIHPNDWRRILHIEAMRAARERKRKAGRRLSVLQRVAQLAGRRPNDRTRD